MVPILKEIYRLTIGKHAYSYTPPPGPVDDGEEFNCLTVDDRVISAVFFNPFNYEGSTYFVCPCDDYNRRKDSFESGRSYSHNRTNYQEQLEWDDVATCNHIALVRRFFAPNLVKKVLEEFVKEGSLTDEIRDAMRLNLETNLFPRQMLRQQADYYKSLRGR